MRFIPCCYYWNCQPVVFASGGLPLIVARVETSSTSRRVSLLLLLMCPAYMEVSTSRASAVHSIVLTYIVHTGCILRCTVHMLWIWQPPSGMWAITTSSNDVTASWLPATTYYACHMTMYTLQSLLFFASEYRDTRIRGYKNALPKRQ